MLHIKGTAVLDTMEAIKARAGKEELDKIISHLDPQTREIFQRPISPSSWYSCDAFSRFLEADIRDSVRRFSPQSPDYRICHSRFFPEGAGDLRRKKSGRTLYRPQRSRGALLRAGFNVELNQDQR